MSRIKTTTRTFALVCLSIGLALVAPAAAAPGDALHSGRLDRGPVVLAV